ncbi:MAG: S24/S26 family peptidase [Planctomycetota bacterium]
MHLGQLGDLCGELLEVLPCVAFTTRGLSMHPTIRDGQYVKASRLRNRHFLGRIILYRTPEDRLTAHRIVARLPGRDHERAVYLASGDALLSRLDRVSRPAMVAEIVAVERDGTWRRIDSLPARLYHVTRFWARFSLAGCWRRALRRAGEHAPSSRQQAPV